MRDSVGPVAAAGARTVAVAKIEGARGVQPGDRIEGALVVTDTKSWVEDVRVTARGLPTAKRVALLRVAVGDGDVVPDLVSPTRTGARSGSKTTVGRRWSSRSSTPAVRCPSSARS